MSALAPELDLARSTILGRRPPPERDAAARSCAPAGAGAGVVRDRDGPTLDDVVVAAADGLAARGTVACPVCRGAMVPRLGAGSEPVGGRCTDCGSTLT